MRNLRILIASGLMVGGLVSSSPAAWARSSDDFTLTGKITDFDKEDRGEKGPSKGDELSLAYDLFDRGDKAGEGSGSCVLVEVDRDEHKFTAYCRGLLDLEDGAITMAGKITEDDFQGDGVALPITGGTGDYKDAEGEVRFEHGGGDGHGGQHSAQSKDGKRHSPEFKVIVDLD